MKTQKSFFNKSECTKTAKKFRSWANLGGFDGYESTSLTPGQCTNIADQFEIARENGGDYFSNIINYPFFTQNEIETILTAM